MEIRANPGPAALICPYCRDPVLAPEAFHCPDCSVALHGACLEQLKRCPSIGCGAELAGFLDAEGCGFASEERIAWRRGAPLSGDEGSLLLARFRGGRVSWGVAVLFVGSVFLAEGLMSSGRDELLYSSIAILLYGLAVVTFGRRELRLDLEARELVDQRRWMQPRWRAYRRSYGGLSKVVVTTASRQVETGSHRTFAYWYVALEGAGLKVTLTDELGGATDYESARLLGARVASFLGLSLEDRVGGGEEVDRPGPSGLWVSGADEEAIKGGGPELFEGRRGRLSWGRDKGVFELGIAPPGWLRTHAELAKQLGGWGGVLTLMWAGVALGAGNMGGPGAAPGDGLIWIWLLPGLSLLLVIVGMLLLWAHASWGEALRLEPDELIVERRLPFPGKSFSIKRDELIELRVVERSVTILGGVVLVPAPKLLINARRRVVTVGAGVSSEGLQAARRAVLAAFADSDEGSTEG